MSALTCEFCGRISTKTENWRQIFTRSISNHDDEQMHYICPKCHKKVIEETLGAIVDPELELDAVRENMDDDNPMRFAIGMNLRDFLCSDAYLRTQNIFFKDNKDVDIKEYMPCMDSIIIDADMPDEQGKIFITLDIDILKAMGEAI